MLLSTTNLSLQLLQLPVLLHQHPVGISRKKAHAYVWCSDCSGTRLQLAALSLAHGRCVVQSSTTRVGVGNVWCMWWRVVQGNASMAHRALSRWHAAPQRQRRLGRGQTAVPMWAAFRRTMHRVLHRWRWSPLPGVALVHGHVGTVGRAAAAGGVESRGTVEHHVLRRGQQCRLICTDGHFFALLVWHWRIWVTRSLCALLDRATWRWASLGWRRRGGRWWSREAIARSSAHRGNRFPARGWLVPNSGLCSIELWLGQHWGQRSPDRWRASHDTLRSWSWCRVGGWSTAAKAPKLRIWLDRMCQSVLIGFHYFSIQEAAIQNHGEFWHRGLDLSCLGGKKYGWTSRKLNFKQVLKMYIFFLIWMNHSVIIYISDGHKPLSFKHNGSVSLRSPEKVSV